MKNRFKINKKKIISVSAIVLVAAGLTGFYAARSTDKLESADMNIAKEGAFLKSDPASRKITNSQYDYTTVDDHKIIKTDNITDLNGVTDLGNNLYLVPNDYASDSAYSDGEIEASAVEDDSAKETVDLTEKESELGKFIKSEKSDANDIIVAVIDSGVNGAGKKSRILQGANFSATGDDASDDNGHGTQVADAVLTGTGDNVRILPVKVLDSTGRGTIASLYKGIEYAIEQDADIINISLSSATKDDSLIKEAIDDAKAKGITVVAAAGNYGANASYYSPAKYDSVITVAAVDNSYKPASYSNYGDCIDYAAIGSGTAMSGTSLSAAKVSALCAMLKGADYTRTTADIKTIFDKYAVNPDNADKSSIGHGILETKGISTKEIAYTAIKKDSILDVEDWKSMSVEDFKNKMLYNDSYKAALFYQNLSEKDRAYADKKFAEVFNLKSQWEDKNGKEKEATYKEYLLEGFNFDEVLPQSGSHIAYIERNKRADINTSNNPDKYYRSSEIVIDSNRGIVTNSNNDKLRITDISWSGNQVSFKATWTVYAYGYAYNYNGKSNYICDDGKSHDLSQTYNNRTGDIHIASINYGWNCKLTVDPNGGTLDDSDNWGSNKNTTNIASVYLVYGKDSYCLLGAAARKDYTFLGWYHNNNKVYNADGNYNPDATYYNENNKKTYHYWSSRGVCQYNGDFTVKAKWKKKEVNITYNSNGGIMVGDYTGSGGSSGKMSHKQTQKIGSAIKLESGYSVERPGYNFVGWSTDSKDTKKIITTAPSSNTTVYAIWKKIANSDAKFVDFNSTKSNNTITVTYTKYKTKNEIIEYITPPTKKTDDGVYTFEGYYEKDSKPGDAPVIAATGKNANKVTSSTYFKKDTTLVAKWSKADPKVNPKYNINYYRNTPSGYELYADNSSTTDSSTVEKGKNCTVKANGYKWNQWCTCLTFKGWATSKNGAVEYKAGDVIKNVTKNINLYAVWGISDMNVSIKYHYKKLNKNEYAEDPNELFIEAAPFTKISDIVNEVKAGGVKTGFTYSHYGTTADYSKNIVPPAYPVIKDKVQDSVVIHLYYDRIKYTVELEGDNGFKSISGAGIYEYGTTVNVSAIMKDGYSFVHWKKPNGDLSYTTRKFSFKITANVKRIGVSKERKYNLYVVPYASDETGTGSITYDKTVCTKGTPIKVASLGKGETTTVSDPSRSGYNFSSWVIKDADADKSTYAYTGIRSSGSGATTIKSNVVTMGNRDTYLVAKWNVGTSAYTVNHRLQDIGGKTYTVHKSYKYNATTDTTVTPAVLSLNGFTSPSAVTATVTGNGKTVINYYYKRHYMTINYNVGHNDKKDKNGNYTAYAGFSENPHKGADNKFYKKGEDKLIYVSETEKGEYSKLTTTVWYGSESMKIPNIETIGLKLTGYCASDIDTWKELDSSKKESDLICLSDKANAISFQVNAVKNLIKKGNKTMTVEANWEANRYNLTLNYNYATTKPTDKATTISKDGNSATWVGYFKYDGAIKKIFGADKIKRNGYIFNGWYIGDTQFWNVNGKPTVPLNYKDKPWSDKNGNYKWFGNTNVTASWTPIEWTIKYDANGGTGTMADTKHTYDDVTKKLRKCTFTKTGHTFGHWYASRERKDANGKIVYEWLYGNEEGKYKNGANWLTEAEGKEKGYKKFKFTDEHTCSTITYRNNDVITMHAQWKPNTWTVKYNANGGTGTMADSEHTYGDATKRLSKCTFTRTGYTFNGYWYARRERKDANGNVVKENGKIVYEWLYGNKEGKYVNGVNWFTKPEGAEKGYKRYKFPDEGTCNLCTYRVKDVITMYAQWTPKKYNLTLNYNDATTKPTGGATTIAENGKSATWNDYFTYDAPIKNIFGADKIKRTGYTFNGWFIGGKNGTQFWSANGKPTVPLNYKDKPWSDANGNYKWDGNTNVTAEWTENSYTIKFDGNKPGTASNTVTKVPANKKVKYTEKVTLNEKPSLTGWTFTGWNTKADGTGKGYKYNDVVSKLSATNNATVTLYAQWEENSYNIVFHGNTPVKPVAASSKVTGTVASMKNVKYETAFNLPKITGTKDAFALTGWTFAGWNRSETNEKSENNYRPVAYTDAQEVKGLSATNDATVDLYAQWDANKYKIHFDKNKPSTSNGYDKDSVASHDVTGEMADVEHTYDIKKALPDNKFKLHGWKFKGWNTKADGTGTAIPNKGNVLNLTTDNNKTVTLYAQWEATTYKITFDGNKHPKAVTDLTGSMSPQVLTYDKWTNLNANGYILDGWTFDKWNLNADGSSETSYKDEERVRNICDGKSTTLYAQWKDTTPPDASKTYLRATKNGDLYDPDNCYAQALAVATDYSTDVTTKTTVTKTLDGLGEKTWPTNWINNDVSLDLYSFDNGSGIKLLTTYSGDKEWNKTTFDPSENTKQVKSSKYDTTEGIEVFYGVATDNSKEYFPDGTDNVTKTRKLTVKIDKTAPTGTFTVKTGTLSKPLTGRTSLIYDENGAVIGVNADGMRTEIEAIISDNGNENTVSGVRYVWAVVTDMENAGISKTYKCIRSSGDKYNGTYVAVNDKGKRPDLYSDFGTSRKLIVKVYACDEAGNISVYRDKEPGTTPENPIPDKPTSITPDPNPTPEVNPDNNIITNISIWSQIIRDDKEIPDTIYAVRKGESSKGPVFLLNQSGKVHIVTYGYVDAVDVNFPPELQAAAQIDVAKGQTVKNLGTIANVDGAYVNGRIQLSGSDCTRITDYPFIVPLYLNSSDVKAYTKNGTKWLDGITNGIEVPAYMPTTNTYMTKEANGLYEVKTVNTVTIPYKNTTKVNGVTIPYEPSDKVAGDKRSTASFYCAKDYTGKGEISITDKLHTHLVN